jgi:hypothetical protein
LPGFQRGGRVGFAVGGIVRSYKDGVPGLGDWALRNTNVTERQIVAQIGQAFATAWQRMLAMMMTAGNAPGFGVAPSSPIQAYARQLLAAYGWGGQWGSFNALVMGESGWNPIAQNPTSTAYGIGQFLDTTWATVGMTQTSNPYAQLRGMMAYIKQRYGSPAAAYFAWVHRIPHWYGEGTDSAAPGLALVGERGPELINMKGGEQVIPFAKGGVVDRIRHAERIMRHHPDLGRRWSRLNDSLGAINADIRGDRALVRFGHLHGHHLHAARHRLREDEQHRRHLLRELKPLRHDRHVVSAVVGLLNSQEAGIARAINEARRHNMTRVARHLEARLKHDKNIEGWARWWLSKRWWTPPHEQRVRDNARVRHDMRLAIADLGLPLIPFDQGGVLPPGLTLALNSTGRAERVTPASQPPIVLEFRGGSSNYGQFLLTEIKRLVDIKGGGNVVTAFNTAAP